MSDNQYDDLTSLSELLTVATVREPYLIHTLHEVDEALREIEEPLGFSKPCSRRTRLQLFTVLQLLHNSDHVTNDIAVGQGIRRLAARIHELRQRGYNIKDEWAKDPFGVRYKKYWIEQPESISA